MASIDIFPLTIGGVSPPLNLLSSIFSKNPAGSKYLSYPLDLGSNPTFAHAVQFSVYDYSYPLVDKTEAFVKSVDQTVNGVNSNGGKIKEQDLSKLSSSLKNFSVGAVVGQSYKATALGAPLSVLSLYMPDTLNTTYDSNYTSISMYDTLGVANLIANTLTDKKLGNFDFGNKETRANFLGSQNIKEITSLLAGKLAGAAGLQGGDLTGALRQVFGQIPNPQIQLTYKGIDLRQFQFEFIFTPISSQEAATVDAIIRKFTYYSVPDLIGTDSTGQYLKPPQIFKINFAYTGGNGAVNAISNVFQNTLTNILGSQLSGALSPSGLNTTQPDAGSLNGAKLFTIGDCVLTNVNVDYAPNGWAAYSDGYPVQTRLTLQFKEMDIVTKDRIDRDQWEIDYPGKPPVPKFDPSGSIAMAAGAENLTTGAGSGLVETSASNLLNNSRFSSVIESGL